MKHNDYNSPASNKTNSQKLDKFKFVKIKDGHVSIQTSKVWGQDEVEFFWSQ